jgi:hypothetical protein
LTFLYKFFQNISQIEESKEKETNSINLKKLNEKLINNCILCITNCVNDQDEGEKLAKRLTDTNIIMDLLYLTRDGFNMEMRKTCGGLIARLTKKDER